MFGQRLIDDADGRLALGDRPRAEPAILKTSNSPGNN
jgi:hypothetical protein